jgi:D-alanyl-D-alanine carboxypeptidase
MAAQIDATIRREMQRGDIPGAALAVTRDGFIVYVSGYGSRKLDGPEPVDPETHFEIGSITKQFTAAAILQLAETNKLSLDDRLSAHLPDFPHAGELTLRELLDQTSGLYDYIGKTEVFESASSVRGYDSVVAMIRNKPLAFRPGTQWAYSNTNYIALGRVIEVVSGLTYEAYVEGHLFKPAGMRETVTIDDESRLHDMATGYRLDNGAIHPSPLFDSKWLWSAGEFVSTVGDLAKWDAALASGKILNTRDYVLMQTAGQASEHGAIGYGFASYIDTYDGHRRAWHSGLTLGFDAANVVFPSDHIAIIAFVNDGNAEAIVLANDVFDTLFPTAAAAQRRLEAIEDARIMARAQHCLDDLQKGDIDRAQLSPELSRLLTPKALTDARDELHDLGKPTTFSLVRKSVQGGVTMFVYRAAFATQSFDYIFGLDSASKIAMLVLSPASP